MRSSNTLFILSAAAAITSDAFCPVSPRIAPPRARRMTVSPSTELRAAHAFLPDVGVSRVHPSISIPPDVDLQTATTDRAANKEDTSTYLIHKGRAVEMLKRCVAIEGLSLSKGWTPQATESFRLAVEAVVRANPILTGKLIEVKKNPWPWSRQSELRVIPHVFKPDDHSFVTNVDPPPGMASPGTDETAQDLFDHVSSSVAPYLLDKADFSANQVESESPLFEAKLMDFGDGNAAYSVKMSHAIGDGTTFFHIVSQISSYMNGRTPAKIDWNNPLKATHEIYPETFSERDYKRSYQGPFGWGLLKNIRTMWKRKSKYLLLSKEKIAKKKKELQKMRPDGGLVGANDIIMAAACEMCGSSDIFAFDRSIRGIKDGVPKNAAGNFFTEIPFPREAGKDPFEIRKILSSDTGSYYGTDEVPLMPFLNGRAGRMTSSASITHHTNFPGSELLCQFPSASFIDDLPLDVAVLFRFDGSHWGIMHNFRRVTPSPLLDEIIA